MGKLKSIKAIFWCHEVFRQLGIEKLTEVNSSKNSGAIDRFISSIEESEKLEIAESLFLNDVNWRPYYKGNKQPSFNSSKRNSIGSRVDQILPGTGNYFEAGPCDLIKILESDTRDEAIVLFIEAFKKHSLDNNITYCYSIFEDSFESKWHEIELFLDEDIESKFEQLSHCLDLSHYHKFDSSCEGILFLALSAAYIDAKFNYKYNKLISVTMYDLYDPNKEMVFLYLEREYKIDIKWWFEGETFDKARIQLLDKTFLDGNALDKFNLP